MSVFGGKYLSDTEIWNRIDGLVAERDRIHLLLAQPEISTDPERMRSLAAQLPGLDRICRAVKELHNCLQDRRELDDMRAGIDLAGEETFHQLCAEYDALCQEAAGQLYRLLLEQGYLGEEYEDGTDLKILKFIDYAGPEYAWRLGINIGLDVQEARERLETLLRKGLLERVEGTMLSNYHRQKDWTKHMNHTYYRISRAGKHYLRRLRREADDSE